MPRWRRSRGAKHWQCPIWAWHWDRPDGGELAAQELRVLRLDEHARSAKAAALRCHVSQHSPLSAQPGDEAILPDSLLDYAHGAAEVYVIAPSRSATPIAYFEQLYRQDVDPWGLDARFYEQRKRAALLAALTRPRFRRAFEPGCATGSLTVELARRCDEVVAWDAVDSAVAGARERLGGARGVGVDVGNIPDEWPAGVFDLIVLSEVGYYCADLRRLASRVEQSLDADGVLVACHWRHAASMHLHSAGDVHAALGLSLHSVVTHVEADFLLQVWTRSGESVAVTEGIVT